MSKATADHVGVAPSLDMSNGLDRELSWLLDLDLASRGEAPDVFDRNTADLRREAVDLDERVWQEGTTRFFSRLLAADPLYRCRPIASRRETAARANMMHALERLSACAADAT